MSVCIKIDNYSHTIIPIENMIYVANLHRLGFLCVPGDRCSFFAFQIVTFKQHDCGLSDQTQVTDALIANKLVVTFNTSRHIKVAYSNAVYAHEYI